MFFSHYSDKYFHVLIGTFEVNLNSLVTVEHPTSQRIGACQTIDKRAEANPLHYTAHPN
jgi:hypothetical protein